MTAQQLLTLLLNARANGTDLNETFVHVSNEQNGLVMLEENMIELDEVYGFIFFDESPKN